MARNDKPEVEEEEEPPRPRLTFLAEINDLAKAARILLEAVGRTAEPSTYGDEDVPMTARVSPEIICLRTAYSMWCSVNNVNLAVENRKQAGLPHPMFLFGGPQRRPEPPADKPDSDLPTDNTLDEGQPPADE